MKTLPSVLCDFTRFMSSGLCICVRAIFNICLSCGEHIVACGELSTWDLTQPPYRELRHVTLKLFINILVYTRDETPLDITPMASCSNMVNLEDLITANGLLALNVKIEASVAILWPVWLEIGWMTLKTCSTPFLCPSKHCAFRNHR